MCDQSLEAICAAFNIIGPLAWQVRDSYIHGYYLKSRPKAGLHLRIHEYPQTFIKGPREQGYKALLRIDADSQAEKGDTDAVFKGLLSEVMATGITEIEPYD